ncbi:MAG: MFS transporter [Phycisphaerae bacterium]|nr:MFS transporter [Phycisphaerae bacterium]
MEGVESKTSIVKQISGLPANFWFANIMEMFERLSFFGVRAIAGLYLVAASGQNGLGLDYGQKGVIYTVWALLQCLIPMVSGGYTERYGYRKSLLVAFSINIIGYILMAQSKPIADALAAQGYANGGYWTFMLAACLVATGTAIFKPPVQGTVAKATNKETSSMGWGVFYWVVNIGGALAPMGAAILRVDIDWKNVFYAAAIVTVINFLPAIFLYREPEKVAPAEGADAEKGPVGVFVWSIVNIFKDLRLVAFLLIFSCFWLMFMQLFDLMPNFIDEWVDTSDVAPFFGWFSDGWVTADGQTKPEMIINIDAIAIILLVLFVSWLIRKMSKVAAMIIGMVISLVGFVGAGYTAIGWICCMMIFIFAIGEMTCSPTFSAYIGLIAPKDKKALYMGYSNIPFAIGWGLGNLAGGYFYDAYGAQSTLALKHLGTDTALVARAARATDWSDALEKLPPLLEIDRGTAFKEVQAELGPDRESAIGALHSQFKYDQGQIENMALQYLALDPKYKSKAITGLTRLLNDMLSDDAKVLNNATRVFSANVKKALKKREREAEPEPTGAAEAQPLQTQPDSTKAGQKDQVDLSTGETIVKKADLIKARVPLVRGLVSSESKLEEIGIGCFVHLLPTALNVKRDTSFDKVRELFNPKDTPREQVKDDAEIVNLLWEELGTDPEVLNNLALEYMAQGTGLVQDVVAQKEFEHPDNQLDERAKEITAWVGIDRSKSFAALSAAIGTKDTTKLDAALSELEVSGTQPGQRLYVYLAQQPKHLAHALMQKDWKKDWKLLGEMIQTDQAALALVLEEIDQESWAESLVGWVKGLFVSDEDLAGLTEEEARYYKLAGNKDLIEKALLKKDWAQTPDQAGQLLGLNVFEARALAVADEEQTKQTLWDKYHPYLVWVYLGVIGLLGTIGMIIFYLVTRKKIAEEPKPAAA